MDAPHELHPVISRRSIFRGAVLGTAVGVTPSIGAAAGRASSAESLPTVTMVFSGGATPSCWINDIATPYVSWISTTDANILGAGSGLKVLRATTNLLGVSSTFKNALILNSPTWTSHSASTKRVVSVSQDGTAVTFGMKAASADAGSYGGFRSVAMIDSGVVDVTGTIGMSNIPSGESYTAFFAWYNPLNGAFSDNCTVYRTIDGEPATRVSIRMKNPGGPRRLIVGIYPLHSSISLSSEPYLSVADLMVTPVERLPNSAFVAGISGVPAGWELHDPGSSSKIISADASSVVVSSTRSATTPTSFGGIRGTQPFDPQSEVLLQARVALSGAPMASDAVVMAGWWNSSTMTIDDKTQLFAASSIRTKPQAANISTPTVWPCAATLPAPAGKRSLVLFVESSDSSSMPGLTIQMTIKGLSMVATPSSGWDAYFQPPYTATSWNRSAPALLCPDGKYTLFAKVSKNVGYATKGQNEWLSAEVLATGGTGIDLSKALGGSWRVWQLTLIPSINTTEIGKQVTRLGVPSLTNVPNDHPAGALRTARHVMSVTYSQVGSPQPAAIRTALDRNFTNFTLVQGDVAPRDNAATQRRAEIRAQVPLAPYSTPIWTSFSLRLNKRMERSYCIASQWHCSSDPGDQQHYSPDLSLVLAAHPTGTWAQITARSDGGVADYSSAARPPTLIENNIKAQNPLTTGLWYNVVIASNFSRSGGGSIRWWLNGTEVSNPDARIPVGYSRIEGLGFMYGAYTTGTSSDVPNDPQRNKVDIDFANVEYGTADLSSRITRPRTILVR